MENLETKIGYSSNKIRIMSDQCRWVIKLENGKSISKLPLSRGEFLISLESCYFSVQEAGLYFISVTSPLLHSILCLPDGQMINSLKSISSSSTQISREYLKPVEYFTINFTYTDIFNIEICDIKGGIVNASGLIVLNLIPK